MKPVLVFGDPMLDVWKRYTKTRDNPEGPGTPVTTAPTTDVTSGGALNVAVNLARLGHVVSFLMPHPLSGNDWVRLEDLLDDHKVILLGTSAVGKQRPAALTRKIRHVVDHQVCFREDHDVLPDVYYSLAELTRHFVDPADYGALVIVDYAKGACWPPTLTTGLLKAFEGVPILVDGKPRLFQYLAGTEDCELLTTLRGGKVLFKCNRAELLAQGFQDVITWRNHHQIWAAVVTHGPYGAAWANRHTASAVRAPTGEWQTENTCGAGDIVTASLVNELLNNEYIDKAVERAVTDATWACTKANTAPGTLLVEHQYAYDDIGM